MNLPAKGKVNRDGRPQANRRVRRGCCDNHHDAAVYEETGLLPQALALPQRVPRLRAGRPVTADLSDTAGSPDRLEARNQKSSFTSRSLPQSRKRFVRDSVRACSAGKGIATVMGVLSARCKDPSRSNPCQRPFK